MQPRGRKTISVTRFSGSLFYDTDSSRDVFAVLDQSGLRFYGKHFWRFYSNWTTAVLLDELLTAKNKKASFDLFYYSMDAFETYSSLITGLHSPSRTIRRLPTR